MARTRVLALIAACCLATLLTGACGGGRTSESTASASNASAVTTAASSTSESDAETTAGPGSDSDAASSDGTSTTDTTDPATDPTTDPATEPTTDATDPATEPTTDATTELSTTDSDSDPLEPDVGEPQCPPDSQEKTFDYIWIANTSEGTVSKINTMTGVTEAKYHTAPQPSSPSRTSVNQFGDVAVSNREPAGVTKVSAVLSRCVDKNNNGEIDTSTGLNDVLPWGQDECVRWHVPIPDAYGYEGGARATAWEGTKQDPVSCQTPDPRLWVGYRSLDNIVHVLRFEGATGAILDDVQINNWNTSTWGPYGGAVNSAGDFFTNGYNNELSARIDAETLQVQNLGPSPGNFKYGMGVDANGNMWVGSYDAPHNLYFYNAQTNLWQGLGPGGGSILGVAVDHEGRVWGAGTGPCRLVEADVETKTFTNTNIALPGCSQPWGVSVDNEGYVWVVDKGNIAFKVDPDTYAIELTVTDLIGPYTYSDMTGQGLQLVIIQ